MSIPSTWIWISTQLSQQNIGSDLTSSKKPRLRYSFAPSEGDHCLESKFEQLHLPRPFTRGQALSLVTVQLKEAVFPAALRSKPVGLPTTTPTLLIPPTS